MIYADSSTESADLGRLEWMDGDKCFVEAQRLLDSDGEERRMVERPGHTEETSMLGSLGHFLDPPPPVKVKPVAMLKADERSKSIMERIKFPEWADAFLAGSPSLESRKDSREVDRETAERGRWRDYKWHHLKRTECPQLFRFNYGRYKGRDRKRVLSNEEVLTRKEKTWSMLAKAGYFNSKDGGATRLGSPEVAGEKAVNIAEEPLFSGVGSWTSVFKESQNCCNHPSSGLLAEYDRFIQEAGPVVDVSLWAHQPLGLHSQGIKRLHSVSPRPRSQLLQTREEEARMDTVDGCSWWVDDWMEKWSAGVRKEALDRLRRREELREEGLSRSATPSVGSGTDPPSYRRPLVQQVLPFQRSKFHSLLPPELIRRSNRVTHVKERDEHAFAP